MDDFEQLLKDILKSDASPGTLHLVLSKLKAAGHIGLVIRECRKALDTHPTHNGLRILLAETCLDSGLTARASDELERVARNLHESARVYALLADAYERQGRHEEAAQCLDLYLAHNPEDSGARESLERIRPPVGEMVREPLEAPDQEPSGYPPDETLPEIATPTLAELYFSQGQLDAAVETYEKVLARSPDDSKARARLNELKALTVASPDGATAEKFLEEPPVEPSPAEDEIREEPLVDVEKAAALDLKRRKSERTIAILEGWLSRIQDYRINAST